LFDDVPKQIVSDALVVVAQHVAYPGDLAPRNFRMPRFDVIAEMAAGFRDDLDAAFEEPALALVRR
jgi:hypothetical protein